MRPSSLGRSPRRAIAAATLVALLAASGPITIPSAISTAHAAPADPDGPAAPDGPDASASTPDKLVRRSVPDYDGRPPPARSAGAVLVWIPRLVLLPPHLVIEYVVRRPIVHMITYGEQHYTAARIRHLFIWRDGRMGLLPTFFLDFGLNPSVGLYFFVNDLGVRGHRWVLRLGTWGLGWVHVASEHSLRLPDRRTSLALGVRYVDRPDRPFYGIGPYTLQAAESFFRQRLVDGSASVTRAFGGVGAVSVQIGARQVRFGPGQQPWLGGEDIPSIEVRHPVDDPALVPGFDGYSLAATTLAVSFGAAVPLTGAAATHFAPGPRSGLRFDSALTAAVDPGDPGLRFLRWGGDASAWLDTSGAGHVLGLNLHLELVDPVGPSPVPITELASLGGPLYMQGFRDGRFRGRSALALTADYRWPIWTRLDGRVFLAAGNAFAPRFGELAFDHLHLAWGFGVRTNDRRDSSFELLVGFGSNRLDAPRFRVDDVRFVLGINRSF